MPGVGSIKSANYLYSQAPRDGSTIGSITQFAAMQQVVERKQVRYDARVFNWLGRMTSAVEVTVAWHTSPVKTIQDAMKNELIVGATSRGSSTDLSHKLMNIFAGTKFKIVLGYKGSTGSLIAMERGEVKGALGVIQSLVVKKKDWIRDRKISVLVQYALKRHPAFPNAPAMVELAKNDQGKQALALYGAMAEVGRSLMAPPKVPADRLAALQKAFNAMVKDKVFLAEAKKHNMEIDPLSGPELKKVVDEVFNISPAIAAQVAAARLAGTPK